MAASETTSCGRHSDHGGLKCLRQRHHLTSARVNAGKTEPAELLILAPKFHLETSSSAIEKNRACQERLATIWRFGQCMPCDQEIVGPLNPEHLYAKQDRRHDNCMHPVPADAVTLCSHDRGFPPSPTKLE